MPIKKIDGGYEVRYDTYDETGKRKQHRRRFRTSGEAKEFHAKQLLSGEDVMDDRITIKQWIDQWLEVYVKPFRKPRTCDMYGDAISLFFKHCDKNIRLTKFKRHHIQSAINDIISKGYVKSGETKHYSAGAIKSMKIMLSCALKQAIIDGYIKENPATHCVLGGEPKQEIQTLSADEIKKLLASFRDTDFYIPFFIASYMGLRIGEVAGLKWSDIDLKAGTLTVNRVLHYVHKVGNIEADPKTKYSTRTLDMPRFVINEFKQEKKRQTINQVERGEKYAKTDYVCRRFDGKTLYPYEYNRYLRIRLKDLGFPKFTFHVLRHSCISLLISESVPLTDVSKFAGHKNMAITSQIYAHAIKGSANKTADAMDRIYNRN